LRLAFGRNAKKFNNSLENFIGFCYEIFWRKKIDTQSDINTQINLLVEEVDKATVAEVRDILAKRIGVAASQEKACKAFPVVIPS
jgi:hypothetical protein